MAGTPAALVRPLLLLEPQGSHTLGTHLTHRGAAKHSCSPCQPLALPYPASGSAWGAVVAGNQQGGGPGWLGRGSGTFCHLHACPGLHGCGAAAWGQSSSAWEISASQGFGRLPRKDGALGAAPGAHRSSPCLSHAPGLPDLPSPQPQVLGTQQDPVLGAAAGTSSTIGPGWWTGSRMSASAGQQEREQGAGSSAVAASLERLLRAQSPQSCVALIHIFIRINEACNNCTGEAKQAAERQRQWMAAGAEEDKAGHCKSRGA